MKTETLESICIGICAANVGDAETIRLINTGRATAKFIQRLTYKQFREIKKQSKDKQPHGKDIFE